MSETPPAGWYPDPQDDTKQRYWDGTTWTEHTAPAATAGSGTSGATPAAEREAGVTATAASSATTAGYASGRSDVDSWTWQSIVVTILCCSPLGVAGALNAGRSEAAARAGDLAAAQRYAAQAKKWTLWGLAAWVAVIVLYGLFMVVVVGSSGVLEELQQL